MKRLFAIACLGAVVAATGCGSKQKDSASTTGAGSALPSPTVFVLAPFRTPKLVYVEASPDEIRAVQDDARKLNDAFYAGDFKTLLELQHPTVIDKSGGPERALEAMQAQWAQSNARGVKIESFEFPEPPAFIKTSVREYVLVPTKKVLNVGGERAELVNFQFGVRAIGDPNWAYVDGAQITPTNVNTLFPDFPADCPLPTISRKKV